MKDFVFIKNLMKIYVCVYRATRVILTLRVPLPFSYQRSLWYSIRFKTII